MKGEGSCTWERREWSTNEKGKGKEDALGEGTHEGRCVEETCDGAHGGRIEWARKRGHIEEVRMGQHVEGVCEGGHIEGASEGGRVEGGTQGATH